MGLQIFVIFQEIFKSHEYRTSLFDFVDITTPEVYTMSIVDSTSPIRRSCIQYRVSKKGYNREILFCQSCYIRGIATQCIYKKHVSLSLHHSTIPLFGSMESKRKINLHKSRRLYNIYQADCIRTEALDKSEQYLQSLFDYTAI